MIGPIADSICILSGTFFGTLLGNKIPAKIRKSLPLVFGYISMGLGITMFVKAETLPAVILAILAGTSIGELLGLDTGVRALSLKLKGPIEKILPVPGGGIPQGQFLEKFAALVVLFSISGTGIFGALKEGMDGDPTLLITKAFLDFFTAGIFAASLGLPLALAAIPQFVIQTLLLLGANLIIPLTNEVMIADFSAVGGLIMLATGFNISDIRSFPVTSMLPALIIVMPISQLWLMFF